MKNGYNNKLIILGKDKILAFFFAVSRIITIFAVQTNDNSL